jgi:fatty-acyl-CoA synthase
MRVSFPFSTPAAFAGRVNYIDHIHPMLASARPSAVLAPGVFLDMVRHAAAGVEVSTFEDWERMPEDGADLPPVGHDALCYLQFSSGSTRSPT